MNSTPTLIFPKTQVSNFKVIYLQSPLHRYYAVTQKNNNIKKQMLYVTLYTTLMDGDHTILVRKPAVNKISRYTLLNNTFK